MNILGVIYRYQLLKLKTRTELLQEVPRVVIFSGKSAPGYYIAKLVIKLINSVAEVVNNDKEINNLLKVVFIPNYSVSLAEILIPSSDISEHISTAGTEASGTSNMKFVLSGGLIIGTEDGANIEIGEEIGDDNIFFFGEVAKNVEEIRHQQRYHPAEMDSKLKIVVDSISMGKFGDAKVFEPLLATLTVGGDFYLISRDFTPYIETQRDVDLAYADKIGWVKKSIMACAGMGKFSSDRSIEEYAKRIWGLKPCPVP